MGIEELAGKMRVKFHRDECNDRVIDGKAGNIHEDGAGFSVAVMCGTARKYNAVHARLGAGFERRQTGDTEGVYHAKLDNAGDRRKVIKALKIHVFKVLSEDQKQKMTARLADFRAKAR